MSPPVSDVEKVVTRVLNVGDFEAAARSGTVIGVETLADKLPQLVKRPSTDTEIAANWKESREPGASWKETEVQEIPHNNMKVVFLGLMLTVFLAAMDQTIAAVALPTIVKDIGGESGYSWIGSAYLLSLSPLYGKLSDLVGRKPVLFFSIFMFLLGSALYGAAQSFVWLAVCRGVQGIGGGGIIQMTLIVIADITSLEDRGKYGGLLGASWGIASVVGPLVGGVLTDHASWRWCFWINLPTGGAAAFILFVSLRLNPHNRRPLRDIINSFDFVGLFLLMGGTALLLVGFQGAQTSHDGWHSPTTLAPLCIGAVMIVLAGINEFFTSKEPILPPRLFRTRTTTGILVSVFLHAISFFAATYYVPLYFQILGASATGAGVRQLPLSLGSSIFAIISGLVVTKSGRYRPVIWFGWIVMTLGYGLLIVLDEKSSHARQEIFVLIAGIGIGCLIMPPSIGLQAAMPLKDMATATAAFGLVRTLGGTVGIAVGDAIFTSELTKRLAKISGFTGSSSTISFTNLVQIQPASLRDQVLHAYTRSLATMYIVFAPLSFVGLVSVLMLREYSLQRTVHRGAKGVLENRGTEAVNVSASEASTVQLKLAKIDKESQ